MWQRVMLLPLTYTVQGLRVTFFQGSGEMLFKDKRFE